MPDELNLAFVGAHCDKPLREGTAKGSPQMDILLCEPGDTHPIDKRSAI